MFGQLLSALLALGTPGDASLRVTTLPAGARVWVDGVRRGVSPMVVEGLAAGIHGIRVAVGPAWAVQPVDTLITLGPGLTRLRLVVPATLHIISEPAGAVVAEDAVEIGRCPIVLARTPLHAHRLTAHHGGRLLRRWEWLPSPGTVTVVNLYAPWSTDRPVARRSRMPAAALGLASVAMAAGAVICTRQADEAFDQYRATANPGRARSLFRRAERLDRWSSGLWAGFEVSAIAALAWVAAR